MKLSLKKRNRRKNGRQKLTCKDCGKEFVFTQREQDFYKEKGFQNEPQRCPDCRAAKKQQLRGGSSQREMHKVTCASCGKETMVPFKPSGDRPVYCRDCYQQKNNRY